MKHAFILGSYCTVANSYSSALDGSGCHRSTGGDQRDISSAPSRGGGLPKVIAVSHGIASAVSYEADGSKLWVTEEPEEM
jgi:hypothetical protein